MSNRRTTHRGRPAHPDRFDLYIQKANRNLRAAQHLSRKGDEYREWVVVALFYAAVQLTNAHQWAREGTWFRSHGEARNHMNPHDPSHPRNPWPIDVYRAYESLKDASRLARYLNSDEEVAHDAAGIAPQDVWRSMKELQLVIDYFIYHHPDAKLARVNLSCPLATHTLEHLHKATTAPVGR